MYNTNRVVTYINDDLYCWIEKEAKKLGMTDSTFLRFVLLQRKQKGA